MSVARHTIYNVIGSVIPVFVSIVTIPIYLKTIGLDRYGILSVCLLLVGYFNLFDFGLGLATAQKMAKLQTASAATRSRIFWTGLLMSAGLALLATMAFVPLAMFGLSFMKTSIALRREVADSSGLLASTLAFGVLQSVLVGSLGGRREFLKSNSILSLGTLLTSVLPLLVAIKIGPSIALMLKAILASRAIVIVLLFWACKNAVPLCRPQLTSRNDVREMLHFGGWTTLTGVVGPVLVYLDRFAIGAVLSSAAVAQYAIPFSLVSQLSVVPLALSRALMPKLAALSEDESRDVSAKAVRTLAFIVTPLTIAVLVCSGPFLTIWIKSAATASIPVVYLLLFGFWVNSLAQIPFARLQARGRPDILAKIHLIEILPYLLLLYIGMRLFGLPGAALAWSLRSAADGVALFAMNRELDRRAGILAIHAILVTVGVVVALSTDGMLRAVLFVCVVGLTAGLALRHIPPDLSALLQHWFGKLSRTRNSIEGDQR